MSLCLLPSTLKTAIFKIINATETYSAVPAIQDHLLKGYIWYVDYCKNAIQLDFKPIHVSLAWLCMWTSVILVMITWSIHFSYVCSRIVFNVWYIVFKRVFTDCQKVSRVLSLSLHCVSCSIFVLSTNIDLRLIGAFWLFVICSSKCGRIALFRKWKINSRKM